MSAGKFQFSFYELNNGAVCRIKIQPETISGFNLPAAGPATLPFLARVSGSIRRVGVKARSISLRWQGAAPTGYDVNSVVRIPVLTPGVWNGLSEADTVSYLGQNATVVGKSPERVR